MNYKKNILYIIFIFMFSVVMFINVKSENVEIDASNIHNILSTEDTKSKNLLIKNVILTRNKLNNDKTIKKYVSKIDKAIEKVKENEIVLKKLKIKIEEIKEDIKGISNKNKKDKYNKILDYFYAKVILELTNFENNQIENTKPEENNPIEEKNYKDCNLKEKIIKNNNKIISYKTSQVQYGEKCQSEERTCKNGVLSGSYINLSCEVQNTTSGGGGGGGGGTVIVNNYKNCKLNDITVEHTKSITAYKTKKVPYGQTCQSEERKCNNGILSGYNSYLNCIVEEEFNNIIIEAEDGNITLPMKILLDEKATNGKYISVPNGDGKNGVVIYKFYVKQEGEYIIWGKTAEENLGGSDDSFFITIDSGIKNIWGINQSDIWGFDQATDKNNDQIKLLLSAGEHTLKIEQREDGAKLDQIIITSDIRFNPYFEEVIEIDKVWGKVKTGFDFITYKNMQFVAYYNEEGYLTVASRIIGEKIWKYKILHTQVGWDSHNNIVMAIDDNEYLHISGNMHAVPLKYFRTTKPLDVTSFIQINNMIGDHEDKVTYPEFLRGPNNEFIFTYRDGQSGEGMNYYNIYNHEKKTWSRFFDTPLFAYEEAKSVNFDFGSKSSNGLSIAGDWNGDGKDSIGLYDKEKSRFYLQNAFTDGTADIIFSFGSKNYNWLPIAGDWDGDGKDSIGLYDKEKSRFYLQNAFTGGTADIIFSFGSRNYNWLPIAGDWDGDGKDSIGLYDKLESRFYLQNEFTGGTADISFSSDPKNNNWLPIAGDWDGDGKNSIGLYDQVNGKFYLQNAFTGGTADIFFSFGSKNNNLLPIAGDWDGDGKNSIGLYDNINSQFEIINSQNGIQAMNAYPSNFIKDKNGVYHVTWLWRDTGGAKFNHDLSYAKSRDLIYWKNGKGEQVSLPMTINNAEIVDPIPIFGGAYNGLTMIGFDTKDRPIISYIKYDQDGNTQIYNARLESGNWKIYKTSNWHDRMEFDGGGGSPISKGSVAFEPIKVDENGNLIQKYSHWVEGSGIWYLDPDNLSISHTGSDSRDTTNIISKLKKRYNSSYQCSEKDGTNQSMYMVIIPEQGYSHEDTNYLVSWSALKSKGDHPRTCAEPIPSTTLRLYKFKK